ncbi:MAG TPA: gluconokinase, GntK/IdnK-type [Gemmatimonadaceae bacterium]
MTESRDVHVIVVMGVSGAGKTVVGKALAHALGWPFYDADDYHTPENIAKMHRGEGLTDDDRRPWLASLGSMVAGIVGSNAHAVLACSALKQTYRDALVSEVDRDAVCFVYLDVPVEVLRTRLEARVHQFATVALLPSQLETLEGPHDALCVDGTLPVPELVRMVPAALALRP